MAKYIKKISWVQIVGVFVLIMCGLFIARNYTYHQICNKNTCFTVEIASTQEQQQQGLMSRETLAEKKGMVFVFPKDDIHNFWMKNTLIPLDMIWITAELDVVRVLTAQPCIADPCPIYAPNAVARYVLELNAGVAEKYGIQEGMKLKFRNIQ